MGLDEQRAVYIVALRSWDLIRICWNLWYGQPQM